MVTNNEIVSALKKVESSYPHALQQLLDDNRTRIVWQISEVARLVPRGSVLLDLGGGIVPFLPTCQLLGYETVIADDYSDGFYADKGIDRILEEYQSRGGRLIEGDIFSAEFAEKLPTEMHLATSHDSLEHWHESPKDLFHRLWDRLSSDDGVLWLGAPNSANLRKRIAAPLGKAKWSAMKDWYEVPGPFRGHVREPDVEDFAYIANDVGAKRFEVVGRNWLAYRHPNTKIRSNAKVIDKVLQRRASLCSDLYLYAWK